MNFSKIVSDAAEWIVLPKSECYVGSNSVTIYLVDCDNWTVNMFPLKVT